jgi:hypothetical protein
MEFGHALAELKSGRRVTRNGWNGKDMYIVLQAGYLNGIPANAHTAAAFGIAEGTEVIVRPYLAMWTADQQIVPWVASQSDLLAGDWATV